MRKKIASAAVGDACGDSDLADVFTVGQGPEEWSNWSEGCRGAEQRRRRLTLKESN